MNTQYPMTIEAIYISPQHNYFGRHGKKSLRHEMTLCESVSCVAGMGVEGDRFFAYKEQYAGQITFFAVETHEQMQRQSNHSFPASVYRRNVITRHVDLNQWIGKTFRINSCVFEGVAECKPCYWMDEACYPGAEIALSGNGGLRARILSGGILQVGATIWTAVAL